jgi:hypothetical protein
MFRLPAGLPCDRKQFEAYCPEVGLEWQAGKKGPGGILCDHQIATNTRPRNWPTCVRPLGRKKVAPAQRQLLENCGGQAQL